MCLISTSDPMLNTHALGSYYMRSKETARKQDGGHRQSSKSHTKRNGRALGFN